MRALHFLIECSRMRDECVPRKIAREPRGEWPGECCDYCLCESIINLAGWNPSVGAKIKGGLPVYVF